MIGLALLIVMLYGIARLGWPPLRAWSAWVAADTLLMLAFGLAAGLMLEQLLSIREEKQEMQQQLDRAQLQLAESQQRQKIILSMGQQFAEAGDEAEIIDRTLRISRQLLGALGASFVPLDEHSQPLPARVEGELPGPAGETLVEYLASPSVRQKCAACNKHEEMNRSCPLLQDSFAGATGIYCLPLRRGDQDLGILNLYFPGDTPLDDELQVLLRTLLEETALALEGVRLRTRAISTLRELQAVRENTELDGMLSSLLHNLGHTLDADFAQAAIWDVSSGEQNCVVSSSETGGSARHLIDGVTQSVRTSGEAVMLENITSSAGASDLRSLMAVPLATQDSPGLGVLLVASRRPRAFHARQLDMLQTIAGQVALVVHNSYLIAQLEYTAVLEERNRLAREIHDGLAQTLGFLKLKTAQLRTYVEHNDLDQARETAAICYDVLAEAYQDVRQAIDGLRLSASENGLAGWVQQLADDFEEYSDIEVQICPPEADLRLPPEVEVQLMRIVQEALSNVRKHARASQVEVSWREVAGELVVEIRDNGAGFDVEDVPAYSQHGLRGMRERADLIGAEFQVASQPQRGTVISVRLPMALEAKG